MEGTANPHSLFNDIKSSHICKLSLAYIFLFMGQDLSEKSVKVNVETSLWYHEQFLLSNENTIFVIRGTL